MLIYLLIVVYNKDCRELTDKFLNLKAAGASVIVYDNGHRTYDNSQVCKDAGVVYLGGNGNKGLSVAYNETISYCLRFSEKGMICLFDDDTSIPPDYVSAVMQYAEDGSSILLPLLYSGETLISPAVLKKDFHCRFFSSFEEAQSYRGSSFTALNSGMAIPLKLFLDYHYDERLFLDGIDHHFMADMADKKVPFRVMNFQLEHHLSAMEKPSLESALHRFNIYQKDIRVFAEKRWRRILFRRILKLTLQYHTFAFVKKFLKGA